MQSRLRALHHVDVPWRPADLEQREGRILRQGNQNDIVDIVNYVTEGTYDTVMWQKVQAKALFIEQMRRNEVIDNEIEDLSGGDIGSAAAETKAIATGDPRYVKQVELEDEVKRLSPLERAHNEGMRQRDWRVNQFERAIPAQRAALDRLAPIAEQAGRHSASETPARITVDGSTYPDRADTAAALAAACRAGYHRGKDRGAAQRDPLGVAINGVEVVASRSLKHLVAVAAAAGIHLTWDDFSDLSEVVPLLARVYPNGNADVNHFQAAGGMAFVIGQLLDGGLLHGDVRTVAGAGLGRYRQEPFLGPDGSLQQIGKPDQVHHAADPFPSRHRQWGVLPSYRGPAHLAYTAEPR